MNSTHRGVAADGDGEAGSAGGLHSLFGGGL
jgi:hypothetical protein